MICLFFGDLLTLVKLNTVKNVSISQEYSSVFFPPHCFITAGHFPMLSWRDQHGCIDIHLSLSFMKGKSFTSGKERHCLFPIRFVPPHTQPTSPHHVHPPTPRTPPRCRFFTFIVGRGNGCLRAPLCKCACVFEVGRMKASSSV